MNQHYYNEHASAEIVRPNVPASLTGVLELVRLRTDPEARKQGYATELMKDILNDADVEGVVLILSPKTFGQVGLEDLAPWYERFGFMTIQKKPLHLMARQPQVYKTKLSPIAGAVESLGG
jgi:GNAT superfamily N-acetyltransferase